MSKRKTVRPGVRDISPVSIYGEVYGGKDVRKRCVLSLEWKREGVIDGKNVWGFKINVKLV